jgi:ribosomal protein L7/L12
MTIIAAIAAAIILLLILRAFSTRGGGKIPRDIARASTSVPTEDSIRELLLQGRKIQAIKAYRMLHHVDLKQAKEAVEALARKLPPSL